MKRHSAFALLFSVFLLSSCGGGMSSNMVATQPINSGSPMVAGTIYDSEMNRPGWWGRMNPFSSSTDPENQIPDVDASADGKTAASPAPADSGNKGFEPSTLAPGSNEQDFVAKGILTPTVYYKPIFNEDLNKCADGDKVNLRGADNKILASVCPKTKDACDLQGSCMVQQNSKITSYNYIDQKEKGYPHFSIVDLNVCPFGLGVRESCLDPFYNVAADMSFFKAGDVIFVPALVGLLLPGGAKHNGFLIVRDSGGGIDGDGRFDFFSGFYDWKDSANPFSKLKLTDKKTKLPYYRVAGATAAKIKKDRNYPSLPGFQKGAPPAAVSK